MIEDFFNALHSFRTNKLRTVLSLLGIIIGVTSVVIITTLGSSLTQSVTNSFGDFSLDIINLGARWNQNTRKPYIKFDNKYREHLMNNIPQIKNIFYTKEFEAAVVRGGLSIGNKNIFAVEPERLEALGLKIDYGNFFSASDYAHGFQKVIIGDSVAEQLFPEGNAVGKTLTLQIRSGYTDVPPYNFEFEVAGVLKPKNNWVIRTSDSVFVPQKFYWNQFSSSDEWNSIIWEAEVCVFNADDASSVQEQIRSISQELSGGEPFAVWAFSAQSELEQMNGIVKIISLVMASVSGISLLVGGIGIMNIMLVTITERRKEIGIRKALGADRKAIRNQFLVESSTLTLTGGIIGIILGILISTVVVKAILSILLSEDGIEIVLSFDLFGTLISFAVSVFIGIFFGLNPALKAAKLDPVKALAD